MVTLGMTFNSGTSILLLEYKYARQLNHFSSNDKYIDEKKTFDSYDEKKWESLTSEEIEAKRIREKYNYIDGKKSDSISDIISYITWLFVGMLFFVVHWCMHKKYKLKD
jgi:hypothetical protein